jgi:hypothetical protein
MGDGTQSYEFYESNDTLKAQSTEELKRLKNIENPNGRLKREQRS